MTDTITALVAAERIEAMALAGRLRQSVWQHDDDEGRHLACLLGAVDPRVNAASAPCLAKLAPRWVLDWTIEAFDVLDKGSINDAALMYAQMLRDGASLTPAQWDQVSVEFRCWLIAARFRQFQALAQIVKEARI